MKISLSSNPLLKTYFLNISNLSSFTDSLGIFSSVIFLSKRFLLSSESLFVSSYEYASSGANLSIDIASSFTLLSFK